MVIYISGRYSAPDNIQRDFYINLAVEEAAKIMKKGQTPLIPHTMYCPMEEKFNYDRFIRADLELLEKCDAIYLMQNWTESRGAKTELIHAIRIGLKIYTKISDIPEAILPDDDLTTKLSKMIKNSPGYQEYKRGDSNVNSKGCKGDCVCKGQGMPSVWNEEAPDLASYNSKKNERK